MVALPVKVLARSLRQPHARPEDARLSQTPRLGKSGSAVVVEPSGCLRAGRKYRVFLP